MGSGVGTLVLNDTAPSALKGGNVWEESRQGSDMGRSSSARSALCVAIIKKGIGHIRRRNG
jgi:hypothetical protein